MSYNLGDWYTRDDEPISSETGGVKVAYSGSGVSDAIASQKGPFDSIVAMFSKPTTSTSSAPAGDGLFASMSKAVTSLFGAAAKVVKPKATPIVADTSATPPPAGSGGFFDSTVLGIPMPFALIGAGGLAYYLKTRGKSRGKRRR